MINRSLSAIAIYAIVLFSSVKAGVGESAVITLVFPSGARSAGMGEVGTALADDANVAYYNPAGLGELKETWRKMSFEHFREPLLPALNLPDLWHMQTSAIFQPRFWDNGGWALDFNLINMGINEWTDEMGRFIGRARSYEYVVTASWGADIFGIQNHYLGASLKYVNSVLAPIGNAGEGTGTTFAVDVGYLAKFGPGFRFGLNVANMGPSIFYVKPANSDPIPFTINAAIAFKDTIAFIDIAAETRFDREFVKNHVNASPDPFWKALGTSMSDEPFRKEVQQINIHTGVEIGVWQRGMMRSGFLFDYIGERYEWTFGLGGRPFEYMQIDWSYIYSPEGFMKGFLQQFDSQKEGGTGVRNGQWRFCITYLNSPNSLLTDIAKGLSSAH